MENEFYRELSNKFFEYLHEKGKEFLLNNIKNNKDYDISNLIDVITGAHFSACLVNMKYIVETYNDKDIPKRIKNFVITFEKKVSELKYTSKI
ncbi:MAG TPA: hypothetical protein VNX01_15215 [Bacteroidia bacterium]|jgi:hypothetical protein|nr:hypothetical protein [Bacteroidia bacterium]